MVLIVFFRTVIWNLRHLDGAKFKNHMPQMAIVRNEDGQKYPNCPLVRSLY